MKPIKIIARDLHAVCPDDYWEGAYDIVVLCDDGKVRYSEDLYDTKDAAEVALAGFELAGIDGLSFWGVVSVPVPGLT